MGKEKKEIIYPETIEKRKQEVREDAVHLKRVEKDGKKIVVVEETGIPTGQMTNKICFIQLKFQCSYIQWNLTIKENRNGNEEVFMGQVKLLDSYLEGASFVF